MRVRLVLLGLGLTAAIQVTCAFLPDGDVVLEAAPLPPDGHRALWRAFDDHVEPSATTLARLEQAATDGVDLPDFVLVAPGRRRHMILDHRVTTGGDAQPSVVFRDWHWGWPITALSRADLQYVPGLGGPVATSFDVTTGTLSAGSAPITRVRGRIRVDALRLLVNVILFPVSLLFVAEGAWSLRSGRRRRRGLCVACAHPLSGPPESRHCTECGAVETSPA